MRGGIAIMLALGLALSSSGVAGAADVGATGEKLVIKDNTLSGHQKVVSLQRSPLIDPGATGNPALIDGSLLIYYVDSPVAHSATLAMPAPWAKASGPFKYKNILAPAGPSVVKSSTVKAHTLAKVVAKGSGGLDISTPPGPNGVVTVLTLNNGNDATTLKICSRYAVGAGSTILHRITGSGFSLKLKNGVGTTCPNCTDGFQNNDETDVDCGGSCGGCPLDGSCNINADCQAGMVCSGNLCQCPNTLFTFTVNSNTGGPVTSADWPGGTTSQSIAAGCSVTINRPDDNIDLVCSLAAPFSVNGFSGFSNCFGTGGEDGDGCQPVSCPPLGVGSCCNTRPSCSVGINGSGSAQYFVQCLQ